LCPECQLCFVRLDAALRSSLAIQRDAKKAELEAKERAEHVTIAAESTKVKSPQTVSIIHCDGFGA